MIEPTVIDRTADCELMQRIAAGDQQAFSALYDRLSGPLFSLALEMLHDASEAEDTFQEVLPAGLASCRDLRCQSQQPL